MRSAFVASCTFLFAFVICTRSPAGERLKKDDVVKEGERYISYRVSGGDKMIVTILDVLPNNQFKVKFGELPDGFNDVRRKSELERLVPVGGSAKLEVGTILYHDKMGNGHLHECEVLAASGGKIKIHYSGKPSAFDKVVTRTSLAWVDPPAKAQGSDKSQARGADSAIATAGDFRTWTDSSGKFSIRAKLVSVGADKVELQKDDGKTLSLPLDKLSPADRMVIEASKSGQDKNPFESGE